jgi:holo-[acyl-carrier protein] synthase
MIRGLGVDIVEIDRMQLALTRHPRMKERVFSDAERAYCEKRGRPEVHYALRFAAKEAVLKALGTGFSGMRFRDVEVARDERGRPTPVLHGRAREYAESIGVTEMHLSLSFTQATAVASAVVLVGDPTPRPEPPLTQKEQVAAMFKTSRKLLDELDAEGGGESHPGPDETAAPDPAQEASPDPAEAATPGDGSQASPGDPSGESTGE